MYSTIYWITRLDGVNFLFTVLAVLFGIAALFAGIFGWPAAEDCGIEGDKLKTIRKSFKTCIVIVSASLLGIVFIPTKNDAILIYAGGKAYEYIQKDSSLQKLPFQTTEYLKVVLQNEINEVKKKSN